MRDNQDGPSKGPHGVPPTDSPPARTRVARPADAAALMALKQHLDRETSFMLLEMGERDTSVHTLARHLGRTAQSANSVVILAEVGGDLVGYIELTGGTYRRSRATAHLVIGVLAKASGKGIGTGLMTQALDWASVHGLHRLELSVMAHNDRAIALYERMGFSVEGRRSECLLIDGQFVDELCMAAFLPEQSLPDDG